MKILQLVTRRQFRGAEVFAANLSSELIDLGHDIIFAGLYRSLGEELKVERAKNIDLSEEKRGPLSPALVKEIAKLVRQEKPDVVQCNGSDTLKYMAAASLVAPKIPILYRNISMISRWVNTRAKLFLYRAIFSRVSHVSSVGDEAIEDFIETINFPRSKTSVIRRGIPIREVKDEKLVANYREQLGLKLEHKVVIHVGNFSAEKNHKFLVDLFESIKKDDDNIKLICVGTGQLFGLIQEEVKRKNLNETIFLLGFRKDIPELLALSHCLVLSSKVEGVPGVILEAAAQRTPSIAINVGGVSEVLIDRRTGFLIDGFNKQEFLDKLREILSNESLRRELGTNAYNLVQQVYDPLLNAEKFEKLYSELQIKKREQ